MWKEWKAGDGSWPPKCRRWHADPHGSPCRRPLCSALQPFIKSFDYHDGAFPLGLERILPDGQTHLMINLAEDEF
jgi:hypothetical protein